MFLSFQYFHVLICKDYYVAITVQFIDNDWKLRNIPVAFAHITGPHTAKAIGEIVADKLSFFLGTYFLFFVNYSIVYFYSFE